MPLRVVHVVPHVDKEASGPSYSVPRLCQAVASQGAEVELLCLAAAESPPDVRVSIFPESRWLKPFGISSALLRALSVREKDVDIIHNHSLWMMPNIAAGMMAGRGRAQLVTSPRGTLSTWALSRSRFKKSLVWPLQRRALFSAACIHATAEEEYLDVRRLGVRVPVAVLPNGVDIPVIETPPPRTHERRCVLFLGRIHPVKGIDLLLEAWKRVESQHAEWDLVIAGPGEDRHVRAEQNRARDLGLQRVRFFGPAYGPDKSALFLASALFVLPSHSENFGMAIAEAMAFGLPVITTTGTPWKRLDAVGAGWCIERDVENLVGALNRAMSMSADALHTYGMNGRTWMTEAFSWKSVGQRMMQVYVWLTGKGPPPECVRLD
jgi:glycosyltransferase involved in cell wall biosynthesis